MLFYLRLKTFLCSDSVFMRWIVELNKERLPQKLLVSLAKSAILSSGGRIDARVRGVSGMRVTNCCSPYGGGELWCDVV